MDNKVRFGVSFEPKLLEKFDKHIKSKGYKNRSEAIRDIIREKLGKEAHESTKGIIQLMFDPRTKSYQNKISDIENEYHCQICSINRYFVDHHTGFETIYVNGKKERIERFIAKLKSLDSVKKLKFDEI